MTANETPSEPEITVETPETPSPTKTRIFVLFSVLIFIMAILAFAVSLYVLINEKDSNIQLLALNEKFNTRVDNLKNEQKTFLKTMQLKQDELQTQINILQTSLKKLEMQKSDLGNTWAIHKARAFLELAHIQSQWGIDRQITLDLLQQTEKTLSGVTHSSIIPIRNLIASEIAKLKEEPKQNLAAWLQQLESTKKLIDTLPLAPKAMPVPSKGTASSQSSNNSWRSHFDQSLQALENMVVIRKQTEEVKPLLSHFNVTLLREYIQLNLQKAEWALLQGNTDIYQNALNQAKERIASTFDMQNPATQAVMKELKTLESVNFNSRKPDIEAPLNMLNDWLLQQNLSQSSEPLK